MNRRDFIGAAIGAPCSSYEPACSMPRSVFEIEWHAYFWAKTACWMSQPPQVTW